MPSVPRRGARRMTSFGLAFGISALVLAGLLTGCAPAESGLQAEAARQLQAKVLSVSEAVAANNTGSALQALDALTADLESKSAKGELSADRKRSISTVIAAVRADLTTVQLSAPAASVTKSGDGKPTAEVAAPVAPAPEPESVTPQQQVDPAAPVPAVIDPVPAAPATDPAINSQDSAVTGIDPKGNNGNGKGGLGKGQDK